MSFLLTKLEKEPKIVELHDPVRFVGLSTKTDMQAIYQDATRLGKEYTNFKSQHPISNLKEPWTFVAYSKNFDESTKSWEYLMGDVVNNLDSVPEGLSGYEIPSGKYAIFTMRAKFKFMWGMEIGRVKRHIFAEWLPASQYKSNGCDFEYHDQRSVGRHSSIDLYVAIEEK